MVLDVTLLFTIAILLFFAKAGGELAEQFRISPIVGEVAAGIVAGPLLGLVKPNPFIEEIASLGILFLLFIIGLSTQLTSFKKNAYVSSILAIGGALLSFVLGFAVGYFTLGSIPIALILGLALLSTSTAVALRSLEDLGEFHSRIFNISIPISMADDVIAILSVSLLSSYLAFGSVHIFEVIGLFFAVLGFIVIMLTLGSRLVGSLIESFKHASDENILVSVALVVLFLVSFASEHIGVAAVTGAFLAGIVLSNSKLTDPIIIPKMKTIGYGFFIPIFFAYSALSIDIGSLLQYWWLIGLLLLVGVAAKIIGCGLLSRHYGFRETDASLIGISMIPRGEYSIIFAQMALHAALISAYIYSSIIAFVVLSMAVTPLLFLAVKKSM
ncbi:MAG: cation:proton antiporter [Candidatus Aenigmarchaeota archaeon]|nr:cation:proton antiporter [Candidatus Aenigmarchaeota archaeon]